MNRRSFLLTASSLTLMQLLAGCARSSSNAALEVRVLENSVPVQILREFQRQVQASRAMNVSASSQLADLYELLQTWSQPSERAAGSLNLPFLPQGATSPQRIANLMTLGDVWLAPAIQQGLIQPLNLEDVAGWEQLANQEIWQTLVQRDRQGQPSETGELWAAPYRWGSLMIAYRRDRFEERGIPMPTDWRDLWQPVLQRRISLPESPRAVIGLILKHLGQSANTVDLSTVPNLSSELEELHQQTRFYNSTDYLQPLMLGDTWAAVGWSNEILQVAQRDRRIEAIVPAAGTLLTADVWVRPTAAQLPQANSTPVDSEALLNQWISFFWQPSIATQLSLLSFATSPIFVGAEPTQLPGSLTNTPLLPSPNILQASEFLLPLPQATIDQYQQAWLQVRQSQSEP
jgi:putative spermidine/putrescine transport system substrate-binding protein